MIVEAYKMTDEGLTGRTRFRAKARWFRSPLLVLQVEESRVMTYNEGHVTKSVCFWRDALAEDLLTGESNQGSNAK